MHRQEDCDGECEALHRALCLSKHTKYLGTETVAQALRWNYGAWLENL